MSRHVENLFEGHISRSTRATKSAPKVGVSAAEGLASLAVEEKSSRLKISPAATPP